MLIDKDLVQFPWGSPIPPTTVDKDQRFQERPVKTGWL